MQPRYFLVVLCSDDILTEMFLVDFVSPNKIIKLKGLEYYYDALTCKDSIFLYNMLNRYLIKILIIILFKSRLKIHN